MSAAVRAPRIRPARVALHAFLIAMAALWIFPLFWAIYSSLRPISDTIQHGYLSWPSGGLSLVNYQTLWTQGELPYFYLNTLVIAVPAVIVTLLLSSMVAFACTQFSWRFNLATLMVFTAGNLLPPQVIIVPLFRIYLSTPLPMFGSIDIGRFSFPILTDNTFLYDQYLGIMLIHIVFQTGFATFVLSNYMKTISKEITESAIVDGAHVLRIWWNIVLPLCRPALAAMATLLFTFIYNHQRFEQPPGRVLRQQQPDRRRRTAGRNPSDPRLHLSAEAVHRWPDAWLNQGLTQPSRSWGRGCRTSLMAATTTPSSGRRRSGMRMRA